jgi:hypothetical protein
MLVSLLGCSTSVKIGPEAVAALTPDGTANINQFQVANLASAAGGIGTFYYKGAVYPFAIGGLASAASGPPPSTLWGQDGIDALPPCSGTSQ